MIWSDGGPKHFKCSSSVLMYSALHHEYLRHLDFSYNFFFAYHGANICDGHAGAAKKRAKSESGKEIPLDSGFIFKVYDSLKDTHVNMIVKDDNDSERAKTLDGIKSYHYIKFVEYKKILCKECINDPDSSLVERHLLSTAEYAARKAEEEITKKYAVEKAKKLKNAEKERKKLEKIQKQKKKIAKKARKTTGSKRPRTMAKKQVKRLPILTKPTKEDQERNYSQRQSRRNAKNPSIKVDEQKCPRCRQANPCQSCGTGINCQKCEEHFILCYNCTHKLHKNCTYSHHYCNIMCNGKRSRCKY